MKKFLYSHTSNQTNQTCYQSRWKTTTTPVVSSVSKNNEVSVAVKHNKKLKHVDAGKMLDNTLSIREHSENAIDDWSKDFCIQTVLTAILIHNLTCVN